MKKTFVLIASACLILASCGDKESAPSETAPAVEVPVAADIVGVASSTEGFTTLVTALGAAGLVETLQGEGPFTVFAPNDEAFAALPEGLVAKLLMPENKDVLVAILTYHVVPGKVTSTEVVAGDVASVEGSTITLATNGGVQVNDATVLLADVEASNGVIHVIDKVLVPPTVDLSTLK